MVQTRAHSLSNLHFEIRILAGEHKTGLLPKGIYFLVVVLTKNIFFLVYNIWDILL